MGIVEELKKEYDIEDTWYGLEIHPETPVEGVDLNKRFGKANLEGMKKNLVNSGKQYGITFGDLNFMPNSHNALEAAEYARSVGKLHEYHEALMKGFFTDGKDIGSAEVLADLGEEVGINREDLSNAIRERRFEDKLKEDEKKAHSLGISSTPTFIINGKNAIVGAQPISVFRELLDDIQS